MNLTDERPPVPVVPRRAPAVARRLRLARHATQATVVAIVVWTLVRHMSSGGLSAEGLCPFGGFETLWTWITTGRTVRHTHPTNLVLAVVLLVMALAGRSFFCGWACPIGAIQGAIHTAASAIADRVPPLRRLRHRARKTVARPDGWLRRLDRVAQYGRFLVLGWALLGTAWYGVMVVRDVDPWAALIHVAEFEFSLAFSVLLVVLTLSVVVRRPFCRDACPLGAIQGLVAKASPVAVQRDADACLGCDLCNRVCPMNIPVNQRTRVTDSTCTACLECVAACPSREALGVQIALPLPTRVPVSAVTVSRD